MLRSAECQNVVQVWFQQDIEAIPVDFMSETIIKEGQGKQFWHWTIQNLENLNHHLSRIMTVGNHLGKKLQKKLDGDPRKLSFGGVMVSSRTTI